MATTYQICNSPYTCELITGMLVDEGSSGHGSLEVEGFGECEDEAEPSEEDVDLVDRGW